MSLCSSLSIYRRERISLAPRIESDLTCYVILFPGVYCHSVSCEVTAGIVAMGLCGDSKWAGAFALPRVCEKSARDHHNRKSRQVDHLVARCQIY
jgi:hypothetical protein